MQHRFAWHTNSLAKAYMLNVNSTWNLSLNQAQHNTKSKKYNVHFSNSLYFHAEIYLLPIASKSLKAILNQGVVNLTRLDVWKLYRQNGGEDEGK